MVSFIGMLTLVHPFATTWHFPSRGNEKFRGTFLLFGRPTILSRRRRISVQGTYELIDSKYQSAEPRRQALPSHQPLAH